MTDFYSPDAANTKPAAASAAADGSRKPRIAIMGEFSAGKSTLSNLLIGAPSLPVKVTATQLPPVWISYGDEESYRVNADGTESPFDLNDLSDISLDETLYLRVFHRSDALELCDLIDMPGISDPNMPSSVWERVLHHADGVVWCTHATQAWRQSEAAVWSMVDSALYDKSLLLLTRIDKIMTDRDRARIVKRVARETAGQFAGVFPISLLHAIEAGEDHDLWQASGADDFAMALIDVIAKMAPRNGPGDRRESVAQPADASATVSVLSKRSVPDSGAATEPRVMPQRVTRDSGMAARTDRPGKENTSTPAFFGT